MSTRKTKDIGGALLSKGFHEKDCTHHKMFFLQVAGRETAIRTRLSHGISEYGDSLLGQMARQLGLNRKELLDLVDCGLTGGGYVTLLGERQPSVVAIPSTDTSGRRGAPKSRRR